MVQKLVNLLDQKFRNSGWSKIAIIALNGLKTIIKWHKKNNEWTNKWQTLDDPKTQKHHVVQNPASFAKLAAVWVPIISNIAKLSGSQIKS